MSTDTSAAVLSNGGFSHPITQAPIVTSKPASTVVSTAGSTKSGDSFTVVESTPSKAESSTTSPVSNDTNVNGSNYLMNDPKLKEVMLSDVGITALLARLKQSIYSAKEFATFVKKKAQVDSEHYMAMKKISRHSRESIRREDGRQGTFVSQVDEIIRVNEKISDVGSSHVASLQIMHDEIMDMVKNYEKTRKTIKESSLRNEKNVSDAEQAGEKAKAKYGSLCEELERMRVGDPTKNKFGFKKASTAQHEEELTRKVSAADDDYKQKVDSAQRMRKELINKLRPASVKELKELTMECDAAISLQLAKYANLTESLALNSGFIVCPLKPSGSATAPLTMKELVSKVDNELDFYNYLLATQRGKKLNRPEIKYEQHASLTAAYPKTLGARSTMGSSNTNMYPVSSPTISSSVPPPQPSVSAAPLAASSPSMAKSTGLPSLAPVASINSVLSPSTSVASSQLPPLSQQSTAPQYPPGTSSSRLPVYGVPLDQLLDYEEGTVPRVVYQCVQAVDSFGLDVEGIYRQSGNSLQTQEIKRLFDADSTKVDLLHPSHHLNDIHSVASALKQYFRELPDALLTKEYYQEFMEAARIEGDVARRDAVHAIVNKLPDPNYTTLRYLIFHLYRIQEREPVNRMSITNLSIIWGPNLLAYDQNDVGEMAITGKVVETILFNAYMIFDAD